MTRKTPKDAAERREAWRRARAACALTDGRIAEVLGRSEQLVRHYKCASGAVPTWKAVRALRAVNLKAALDVISELYGSGAVTSLRTDEEQVRRSGFPRRRFLREASGDITQETAL